MQKFFIFFILLLLGGCSFNRTPVTGLTKYCNSYYVRDSWHYPQRYYEYDEVGIASWYGNGFHGKPKPSGEPFNKNALTAAHKTLPLPSVVKVTNLENGKEVIVVIDDRGPFVYHGRIIDLSEKAAKAVGIYSKGLGTVRVQTLVSESKALCDYLVANGMKNSGRCKDGKSWEQVYWQNIAGKSVDFIDKPIESKPKAIASNNNFCINLGKIFYNRNEALQEMQKIPSGKYNKNLKPIKTSEGKEFYNVFVSSIENSDDAKILLNTLRNNGYNKAIVIKN
jgi:rare lipoprotein A